MHSLNERLDETEFVQVQEVSAGDTLLNWPLEDFSDIVSKSTPSEERDVTEIPVLAPVIGYDRASAIAHHALEHDLTLKEAALQLGHVDEATFDRVIDPARMVKPYVANEADRSDRAVDSV